ncbi:MAG: DNA gyrase subunit A [Chloroflexi bacterium HGW-Chloroflexi-10]|nr:MAG: DNA gyrase subunit A [Chloroflexi bacterium HGW-Chloroflexi-10]
MSDMNEIQSEETNVQEQALDRFIEEAYRRYAVLTILDRALPDVRDGLKPGQRRILYAMGDMGLRHNTPHKKSARVVGEVLGKYHPHGDQSVYDAMVRMAQDFSMRSPLIDGQGNYGSIDGDSAAAMRYTEARLSSTGEVMLEDIDKDTVDWQPNFDGSLQEPIVLPTRFPNLLVNGATGIAVGMSTSILPHNLGEVCDAVKFVAQNWKRRESISVAELMKYIPGPDLPTGGLLYRYRVNGEAEPVDMIAQAYETGHATLVCQAKADIQDIGGGKSEILVTELPYQVQKTTILERIAAYRDKFNGITDVRDESDFQGMRVVFEVARGTDPADALDRLLTNTQMRSTLSHNALALVRDENGKAAPKNLTLRAMIAEFIKHRLTVITRRSRYELDKAEERNHILEGLLKALSMIDEVVSIIRKSQTTETARRNLMDKLSLTGVQAQAILDMPLRRLVSLERKKLEDERKELLASIKYYKEILASQEKRLQVVVTETEEVKDKYAEPRKTVILATEEGHQAAVTVSELVTPTEAQLVMITDSGLQRVDSKGFREGVTKDKPTSRAVSIALLRETVEPSQVLLLVTNQGRMWQGNTGRLPLSANFNDLGLKRGEKIVGIGVVRDGMKLVLVTTAGQVKRVEMPDCISTRAEATWAAIIGLNGGGEEVLFAGVAGDDAHVMVCTAGTDKIAPRILRFESGSVNPQATPSAKGVTAIKMMGDALVSVVLVSADLQKKGIAYAVTANGHAKRIGLEEFPLQGRGGQGVQLWKLTPETGLVVGFTVGPEKDAVDFYSVKGKRLRIDGKALPKVTRATKGVDLGAKYVKGPLFGPGEALAGVVIS